MKTLLTFIAVATLGLGTSCTTMYDSYGQPHQVVSPEGAAIAAVAAGVVGYALADSGSSKRRHHHHNYHRGYGGGYRGGYGGYGGYGGGYCR